MGLGILRSDAYIIYIYVLLCPNLAGFELAPTTAKWGEAMKARAVASVVILRNCDLILAVFSR